MDVDAFGRTAEVIAQYLRKGRPILMEGRLKLDQWEDKQTNQKRSKLGVVLETFSFVDSKGGDGGGSPEGARSRPAAAPATSASEPDAHAMACFAPSRAAISFSNSTTSLPRMKCWLSITRVTAAITSPRMVANCAFKSKNSKAFAVGAACTRASTRVSGLGATDEDMIPPGFDEWPY